MNMDDLIEKSVCEALEPVRFELINESYKHVGHAGDDGSGQTHYKLMVVSPIFEGCGRVQRQRLVNNLLDGCFSNGLHAVSMKLLSPSECADK